MDKYAELARQEANDESLSPRPGGVAGRGFWNLHSSQFLYPPTFLFPRVPKGRAYLFSAEDTNGRIHSFRATTPIASLAPIWSEMPEGFVHLKVESLDKQGRILHTVGSRVFYKCAPFPGRTAYPPKASSYRVSASAAFRFAYRDPMVQHWLIHGRPDPEYPHNVYPSKMIESIIRAMVGYAKIEPEHAENAILLARRAADYLISISFTGDHPLAGLPPTYSFDGLNAKAVDAVAPAAKGCVDTMMMIYPVSAGIGYLDLYCATEEAKYLDAALQIAAYYKANVLPTGSWYLLYDCTTGKPLSENLCIDFQFVHFFHRLYELTKDEDFHSLEMGHYEYITRECLSSYHWEGQFEDIQVSGNYQNLTHFIADHLIEYIALHHSDDEQMVAEAMELMRFVEDQFVVWGNFPLWDPNERDRQYHTPAGLEQYFCYAPIDGSTATIMSAFLSLYQLTGDRLYLEKAMALGDTITRRQNPESGQIPTFWIGKDCQEGYRNFWINCHIGTAFAMLRLAEITEAEGIEP